MGQVEDLIGRDIIQWQMPGLKENLERYMGYNIANTFIANSR
jgi:hypothetical protein